MLLADLITPQRVRLPVEAPDKPGALRELAQFLAEQWGGGVEDIIQGVEERERSLGTGIGFGVAIPHGKTPTMRELGAVCGVTATPISWDSVDGEPVRLLFMLAGPESSAGIHVKVLSRIARLVRREAVRQRLLQATSPEELHRAIRESEAW